jgi:5-methylcytosine-specific restriction endonuclease McrA
VRIGGNQNRKSHHKESVKVWDAGRKATSQRRRAQKAGVESEKFKASEIYERDGWLCGICSERVAQAVEYPDPMSPSLDHIVPLSLGGPHTRANTRLAHLVCNVKRGNRVA